MDWVNFTEDDKNLLSPLLDTLPHFWGLPKTFQKDPDFLTTYFDSDNPFSTSKELLFISSLVHSQYFRKN